GRGRGTPAARPGQRRSFARFPEASGHSGLLPGAQISGNCRDSGNPGGNGEITASCRAGSTSRSLGDFALYMVRPRTAMDENLVGYALNALDPDGQREVEAYLLTHPAARQRLEAVRQALQPLATDRDAIEPPDGLRIRTLARVAEYRRQELPAAPKVLRLRP